MTDFHLRAPDWIYHYLAGPAEPLRTIARRAEGDGWNYSTVVWSVRELVSQGWAERHGFGRYSASIPLALRDQTAIGQVPS